MDETRLPRQMVYDFGCETCRHPCLAFILRAAVVNSKRFFSKSETHTDVDKIAHLQESASRNGCLLSHIALKTAKIFLCVESRARVAFFVFASDCSKARLNRLSPLVLRAASKTLREQSLSEPMPEESSRGCANLFPFDSRRVMPSRAYRQSLRLFEKRRGVWI